MKIQELKIKVSEHAQKYAPYQDNTLTEFKAAEILESDARHWIIQYCEGQSYLMNGLPTEMKRPYGNNEIIDEEYIEDYFCDDRYDHYLNRLTLKKTNVAELTWHYTISFWPVYFQSKDVLLDVIKIGVEDYGFYDVSL